MGSYSYIYLCHLWTKVHRTFLVERGRNCSRSIGFPILDILRRSWDIRDRSMRLCKIDRNFACFWTPNFFWGGEPPEFLDLHYKTEPDSYCVAKFDGDRRWSSEIWRWKKEWLDGQGKARREAARRRNSECKINFSCPHSSRGNGSRPTAHQW